MIKVLTDIEEVASIDAPVPVSIADKDRPILASAIAHKATVLLTGDKRDFGHLFGSKVKDVLILSPRMLTDMMEEDAQDR